MKMVFIYVDNIYKTCKKDCALRVYSLLMSMHTKTQQ